MCKLIPAITLVLLSAVSTARPNSIPQPATFVHAFGQDGQTGAFYLIQNDPASVSINRNFTVSNGTILAVEIHGAIGAGVMRAFSSLSSSNLTGPFYTAGVSSQYFDNVIISFPPTQGMLGYLVPIFALTGSTSVTNTATASADAEVFVTWQDSVNDPNAHFQGGEHTGDAIIIFNPIPFHFGAPFMLGAHLTAGGVLSANGSAIADFGHTATLIGLQVFDQNMNTIGNPTFSSALGLQYSTTTAIVNESCPPANGMVDPGERVTVNLQLVNNGTASTSNLIAALMPSANVLSPSGPQTYGAIGPGGVVGRDFSFTANGNCGDQITLSLQLRDGLTNLGTATYALTLGCNTACAGAPRITTSAVLARSGSDVVATITISNIGTASAFNMVLTTATLGTINGTPLPQNIGNLSPGASSSRTVIFNAAPNGQTTLQSAGTYAGGRFNSNRRVTVP